MNKVLKLIERVKSGLRSFVLDIPCQTGIQRRLAELELKIKTFLETNQRYVTRKIINIIKMFKASYETRFTRCWLC